MKPVIKKQTHYNLLLMRDDSNARTFRVHSTALRVFFLLLVVLMFGGAGGIAGGVHFFKEYLTLAEKSEIQEKELGEMRLQLERLVNLESLIVASNGSVPLAKNEEVGLTARPGTSSPDTTGNGDPTTASPDEVTAAGTANNSTTDTPGDDAPQDQQAAPSGQATEQASSPDQQAQSAYKALDAEDSPLHVAEFSARVTAPQRVRISYELVVSRQEEQRTISGTARYMAVFTDGTRANLSLNDIDGTRFTIARMKPMQSTARMPENLQASEIQSIEVFIEVSDGNVYQQSFAFNQ